MLSKFTRNVPLSVLIRCNVFISSVLVHACVISNRITIVTERPAVIHNHLWRFCVLSLMWSRHISDSLSIYQCMLRKTMYLSGKGGLAVPKWHTCSHKYGEYEQWSAKHICMHFSWYVYIRTHVIQIYWSICMENCNSNCDRHGRQILYIKKRYYIVPKV